MELEWEMPTAEELRKIAKESESRANRYWLSEMQKDIIDAAELGFNYTYLSEINSVRLKMAKEFFTPLGYTIKDKETRCDPKTGKHFCMISWE